MTQQEMEAELDELRIVAEARAAGCQCGDDEACLFIRQRDEARAKLATLREQLESAIAGESAALEEVALLRDEAKRHIDFLIRGIAYFKELGNRDERIAAYQCALDHLSFTRRIQ